MYPMKITPVTEANRPIYLNLAQCYEAEFSKLTHKKPDTSGVFKLDTLLGNSIKGFILLIDEIPSAIAAIALKPDDSYEMCEFYVVPYFRKSGIGINFAHLLWKSSPGQWEIKQIEGAEYATAFWRKAIRTFDNTVLEEDRYNDPYWGFVTRQRFRIHPSQESNPRS